MSNIYSDENELCTFSVQADQENESYEYNICPLIKRHGESRKLQVINEEDTPPTHTKYVYDVAFIGTNGLDWDGTLPANLQCPKGTWICLTVINTRLDHASEPLRILQVVPVADFSQSSPKAKLLENHNLEVALHGGRYQDKKQKALFQFFCNTTFESENPEYSWSFSGTHAFTWHSKHACPVISKAPSGTTSATNRPISTSDPHPEPPDRPPIDQEDPAVVPSRGSGIFSISMNGFLMLILFLVLVLYVRRLRLLRKATISSSLGSLHLWIAEKLHARRAHSHNIADEMRMVQLNALLEEDETDHLISREGGSLPKYGL